MRPANPARSSDLGGGANFMKISIGSDHRGFAVKKKIMNFARELGHEIEDCGAFTEEFSDYPDFAFAASECVGSGKSDRGILICGTSIGMCMSANKVAGVRAASCHDIVTAEMSRRHNNANVLC